MRKLSNYQFTKTNKMKKTTKILTTAAAAVALFFSTNAMAQSSLGVGVIAGTPTDNARSHVLSAELRLQLNVSTRWSIPITGGYTRMYAKDNSTGVNAIDRDYIPVKVGAKYFFAERGSGLYGLLEGGAGLATGDYPTDNTRFIYSPAFGYAWSNGLDLSGKYEGFRASGITTGYWGVRLAYGFKL